MTSLLKPLKSFNTLILVGIMAAAGLAATVQTVALAEPATTSANATVDPHAGKHHHDPAAMQARRAKHQTELKARLALTPAQEGAWSAYTTALQSQAHSGTSRPDRAAMRAELEKLTTPQRIDKMNGLRTQRMAEMNAAMAQRGAATKTFYAALNADQQKVFDAQRMERGGKGHSGHHGHQKG